MNRIYMPRSFDYRSLETPVTTGFLSPQQMANHSIARARCSLIAGVDLALMKATGIFKLGAASAMRAVVQDDTGNPANHAAHAIPCQIAVGAIPIHSIPSSRILQNFLAEPYRFTNILPKVANQADQRVESPCRTSGSGLRNNFENFCQRVMRTGAGAGRLDRCGLQAAYTTLITDYCDSFAIALAHTKEISEERIRPVPGWGTEIDLSKPIAPKDQREDDIRTALRTQLTTLREIAGSAYSPILVEQVENDFHDALKNAKA